jgi:hypothetical protein
VSLANKPKLAEDLRALLSDPLKQRETVGRAVQTQEQIVSALTALIAVIDERFHKLFDEDNDIEAGQCDATLNSVKALLAKVTSGEGAKALAYEYSYGSASAGAGASEEAAAPMSPPPALNCMSNDSLESSFSFANKSTPLASPNASRDAYQQSGGGSPRSNGVDARGLIPESPKSVRIAESTTSVSRPSSTSRWAPLGAQYEVRRNKIYSPAGRVGVGVNLVIIITKTMMLTGLEYKG